MRPGNPYHSGELAIQERAGESAIARRNGAAISNSILGGAWPFLKQQPMVLLSSRDQQSAMWASIVFGRPGFLASDDGKRLEIDLSQALMSRLDPVWENAAREGRLGSLVIDLSTRRRIRINGAAHLEQDRRLWIEVEEAYPACPKYITRRQVRLGSNEPIENQSAVPASGGELTEDLLAAFRTADTIFVATRSAERGYDVSHRGGGPGFVTVTGPRTIRWPEFPGNSMFNTLGNLLHDPHAGLALPDFVRNRVAQLTGTATTLWDQPDPNNETGGTHRFVEMRVDRWQELPLPANLRTEFLDYSPFNPPVLRQGPRKSSKVFADETADEARGSGEAQPPCQRDAC